MRKAEVYRNGQLAGTLTEEARHSYVFVYDMSYYANPQKPAVSLTLPKTRQVHKSEYLFPFFFNMLSEGANRMLQSKYLRIDEEDHFGLLLQTAQYDTIGAVTVKPMTS